MALSPRIWYGFRRWLASDCGNLPLPKVPQVKQGSELTSISLPFHTWTVNKLCASLHCPVLHFPHRCDPLPAHANLQRVSAVLLRWGHISNRRCSPTYHPFTRDQDKASRDEWLCGSDIKFSYAVHIFSRMMSDFECCSLLHRDTLEGKHAPSVLGYRQTSNKAFSMKKLTKLSHRIASHIYGLLEAVTRVSCFDDLRVKRRARSKTSARARRKLLQRL